LILSVNIIDVGLGNVRSIEHWLDRSNLFYTRVKEVGEITDDVIIIPGVASAGEYMHRLKESGIDKEIIKRSKCGQKIIGICLGFQILTDYSEEDGGTKCLGILKGSTEYIDEYKTHNGWSSFYIDARDLKKNTNIKSKKKKLVSGRVYFNHELKVKLDPKPLNYGSVGDITSYAIQNNIFGFQFHPEKSQQTGQELLEMII
jgi:imidazole glycerol-phosphate synthase subunit HisH